MERESAFLKHGEVVQPFLKDAFKEGVHRTKPKTGGLSQDRWSRQKMIGVVYNDIGSSATYEELADKYGTFRQSIADSNKSFLRNLWNNGSPELKEQYPLNEILGARKPLSQASRERRSASLGGVSLRIKEQVKSGVTDINSISENTGIPRQEIRRATRGVLKDWGINLPPSKIALHIKALKQLEEETDDKKIQESLDRTAYHVILYDLRRKREPSRFASLSPLIRKAGFCPSNRETHLFATSLRTAGVPISIKDRVVKGVNPRTLTHYILLSRHRDRVIRVLKEDQSLQRFQR